mmetsp:Transcript_18853/g.29231  ORF Transcript_18853/g.29231 Transcript_18853/m.29231 type:complete len:200 (+) Transcript_18853:183-782(+)
MIIILILILHGVDQFRLWHFHFGIRSLLLLLLFMIMNVTCHSIITIHYIPPPPQRNPPKQNRKYRHRHKQHHRRHNCRFHRLVLPIQYIVQILRSLIISKGIIDRHGRLDDTPSDKETSKDQDKEVLLQSYRRSIDDRAVQYDQGKGSAMTHEQKVRYRIATVFRQPKQQYDHHSVCCGDEVHDPRGAEEPLAVLRLLL